MSALDQICPQKQWVMQAKYNFGAALQPFPIQSPTPRDKL